MDKLTEQYDRQIAGIESYKMMVDLSEGIFHDFKNILATISGLTQLSMLKTDSEEIMTYLTGINKATMDFRDSLDRYYSFTKGVNDEEKPCILYNIVNKALDLIRFKFDIITKYQINLNININSSASVWCSEYEIKQSILNILMNGIDAMEDIGGSLTIDIYNANDDFINLDITDTGTGITKENLDRLFKSKFTTKEKGTGLGLKIAKNCVEKYGGNINIISEEYIGTKVQISLPIYKDKE